MKFSWTGDLTSFLLFFRVGDKDFFVRCAAQCKPKPSIRWLKDGREIEPSTLNGLGSNLFTISTEDSEGRNGIHTVQSVLRFMGADRSNGSQLQPFDSGVYSCVFENEVKRVESSMLLSIERKCRRQSPVGLARTPDFTFSSCFR